jgi:hypothetical protein
MFLMCQIVVNRINKPPTQVVNVHGHACNLGCTYGKICTTPRVQNSFQQSVYSKLPFRTHAIISLNSHQSNYRLSSELPLRHMQ